MRLIPMAFSQTEPRASSTRSAAAVLHVARVAGSAGCTRGGIGRHIGRRRVLPPHGREAYREVYTTLGTPWIYTLWYTLDIHPMVHPGIYHLLHPRYTLVYTT